MTVPRDPAPDFVPHSAPRASEVNARFRTLYGALNKTVVGLDSDSFKDGAFTAAKFPAKQAWQQTPALYNFSGNAGWAPSGFNYYKDQLGVVRFRLDGSVFTTVSAVLIPGLLLTTMPAGYRPGTLVVLGVVLVGAGVDVVTMVNIDTAGNLYWGDKTGAVGYNPSSGDRIVIAGYYKAEN